MTLSKACVLESAPVARIRTKCHASVGQCMSECHVSIAMLKSGPYNCVHNR